MTVVHKKFVIIDIIEMQKAEINVEGSTLLRKTELDMYLMRAILKDFAKKTQKGREFLKKIGMEKPFISQCMEYQFKIR